MKTTIKKTAKMVTIILFTIFTGTMAFAQPPGGGQRGGQQGGQQGPPPVPNAKQIKTMVNDMAKELSWTDKQEASALLLYNDHFEKVKAKTSGNTKPDREEMDALTATLEKNVKALLTADQQKAYIAYLKKQSKQRPQREN
jgi:hypothetical protein